MFLQEGSDTGSGFQWFRTELYFKEQLPTFLVCHTETVTEMTERVTTQTPNW